ncbi:MRC1-like domain-containing protein [Boeremia exigua]|uniref:MRC1-like domain-containing protein n=1 Tax=Boeremia exigua TaxID=749465 RepID=UPI001E8E366C|nr:MRC1-like domain-containing protein [Boeremia exigua]KAH6633592.1 MRC1-like domain-containing protein [Boeremia exigua]
MANQILGASTAPSRPRTKLLAALRKTESGDSSESSTDSASDVSDSEGVLHSNTRSLSGPRHQPSTQTSDAEEEVDAESAYQRMKQRLAAEKETQEQQAQKSVPVLALALESDEEASIPIRKPARRSITEKQRLSSPRKSPSPNVRSRQSSPGLFVSPGPSPAKSRSPVGTSANYESDQSSQRASATDLQERVKRIRAERLAKQKEETAQLAQQKTSKRSSGRDDGSDTDAEIDRRLTQQSKPTRRAGKKALEAMARDQQRISRNMQLTHQAKTKKRYSTKDLFTKFGFNGPEDNVSTLPTTPEKAAILASSDAEMQPLHETPPTSPPRHDEGLEKMASEVGNLTPKAPLAEEADDTTPVPTKVDKGKGRAPEFAHLPTRSWPLQGQPITVRHAQVQTAVPSEIVMVELSDSDDDAKLVKKSRFAVFDRVRTKEQDESKSFVTLRHLAHLTSPKTTRKGPKTITRSEMHFSLAQKARQQAQRGREERIEELKRRGIHIETAEEREKHQMEIEDLVTQFEKQRQEDLKLAKQEKKQAKANGESIDDLPSSDESDEDFVGSDDENTADGNDEDQEEEEEAEIELSGSEDEPMEDADGEEADASNDLADEATAVNTDATLVSQANELTDDEDERNASTRKPMIKRARRVIDDDESESEDLKLGSPTQKATQDDAIAAFGFGESSTNLGLTQMFAGTMANLDDTQVTQQEPEQDSLEFLHNLPDTQPGVTFSQTHDTLVPNSQLFVSPRKESGAGAESHFSLGIGQLIDPGTQFSEAPEPTQDAGFSFSRSQAGFMAPASTVETVMLSVAESPIKKRTGKLQRGRREIAEGLSDVEENFVDPASDLSDVDDIQRPPKHRDAFRAMQKGAKKQRAIDNFNKENSAAKAIVEEQADESEDEYAGIGGASDDESGEEDEEMKKMIDHDDVKVDERQIAAFYADKDKKDDEKNINQLYKDLMNGGLRKRAGRDAFDMSDSEDEAEMRQRRKRADFARMQKALLSDENIGKIAENPKQQAFFKTLADFADDADYEFLEMPEPKSIYAEDSQSQSQQPQEGVDSEAEMVVPDSQTDSVNMPPPNPLKRKSPTSSQKENRPPPNMRRTDNDLTRRPITLADVQNSVSELLEDSRVMVPDSQYASDSDSDLEIVDKPVRKAVVDRLTLSRQSTIDESQDSAGGMAFHAPSRGAAVPGFRVPSLIRQATSNLSAVSERSDSQRTSQSSEGGVRRGGTGRSNIHAQAREAERRALLEKKEKRRKEVLKKKVDGARKKGGMRSVLGDLSGGFE